MKELSASWRDAFARLAAEVASAPERKENAWCVSFDWELVSAGKVLAALPGEFTRVSEDWDEMIDGTGEGVDYECESAVYASDEERALFTFTDHWQAGLGGSVCVFDDEQAYRAALAQAISEECESPGAEEQ
jgi:hypothetical protein